MVLDKVKLTGLTTATAPALRESLRGVVGKPYYEGRGLSLNDRLLSPFRNTGYLDASITDLQRTPEPEQAGTVGVVVLGRVEAGDAYRVSSITFQELPHFTATEFLKATKLHEGDVASEAALHDTYQPILDAYHQLGYVDARIDTQPQVDKAAHTVSYHLTLSPGEPYRVGVVHFVGLSGQAESDVETNWRLGQGAVYNPEYLRLFLRKNTALRSLEPYNMSYVAKADPTSHTVNLTVNFYGKHP